MTAIEDGIIEEYAKLVAFESVGADPMHLRDTVQCAIWLKDWLAKLGFAGELLATEKAKGAPPVLFAERKGAEGAPTILFYGHYDVQPVDPIEEWRTQPFKLTQGGDGRFYARGANDDKGQFFAFLCGMRDFLAETRCAPTIKILLEGQEESGSAALTAMARDIRRKIAADVLLVCDTNAAQGLRPAIVAGLRGVAHFEMTLEGPVCDLHSGEYGGAAPNPAQEIARMAASLHDDAGRVAVEGFYDGIVPPSDEEVRLATESTPDAATFEHETGVAPAGGEKALPIARRLAFEPTLEVNGIHSGWGGAGAKTIIPAKAIAKFSMRLVPGQNPARCVKAVQEHLKAQAPEGLKVAFGGGGEAAAGFRLPLNSPIFRLASAVLEEIDDEHRKAAFVWEGASIPVISELVRETGAAPLIVGFGQPEDRIHAPNESYSVRQFTLARRWAKAILPALCG